MEVMTPNSFCAMTYAPIAGNPVGPSTLPSRVPKSMDVCGTAEID